MAEFYGDIDLNASGKVTGLLAGTADTDAATVGQVKASIEGIAWKDNVRAGSLSNINLAAPGASVGGVAMASTERFLAGGQTAGAENGIYIFNGAATPATRAPDASSFDELKNAVLTVDEGTLAGTSYRQSVVTGTLGVTALVFGAFGTSAPAASETVAGVSELATQAELDSNTGGARIVTSDAFNANKVLNRTKTFLIGDASATSFNCDHNLNTRKVVVQVIRNSGNYDTVIVDNTRPTVNRVTVTFPATYVPSASEFMVIIQGTTE